MDKFSTAELLSFFKQSCPDVESETLKIIYDEKISGKRAMKLDLQGWKNVGISYGEAVDIVGAIDSFQSGDIQFDCNAVSLNFSCEGNEGKDTSSDNRRVGPDPKQVQSNFSKSLIKTNCASNLFPLTSSTSQPHFPFPPGNSDASCSKSTSQPAGSSNVESSPSTTSVCKDVHLQNIDKSKSIQPGQQQLVLNIDSSNVKLPNELEFGRHHSDSSDSEVATDYSSIEQYFQPVEFKEMSVYDKDAFLRQKLNYERARSMPGLSMIKVPAFMEKAEREKRKSAQKTAGKKSSVSNSQLNANNLPSCSKSSRILRPRSTALPGDSNASCSNSTSQPTASSDNATGCDGTSSILKVVHPPNVTKTKNGQLSQQSVEFVDFSDVGSSHESETPSGSEPAKKKRRRRKNNCSENISEEAFSAKLPKFDIDKILSDAGRKLKTVKDTLCTSGILYGKDRKLLIRTLTKHLYFKHVDNIKLVTTEMKSGMAASLVSLYPLFKDETDPLKRSWWRIFNPAGPSGYIANASIGILRSLDPKDRPRGGGQGTSYLSEEDDSGDDKENNTSDLAEHPDAEWMRVTMPWASNKAKLAQGMEASFEHRRRWILSKGPSVTEILNVYPHLMSFDCEFLEKEFSLVCPGKGHLFSKMFPHLIKSLKGCNELHTVEELGIGENCDTLGACLSIANQLPRPNLQKYSRRRSAVPQESVLPRLKELVTIVPLGINVQELVDTRRKDANAPVQPYLLALVPDKDITKLFLVADSQVLQMPCGSILQGLAMLFKSYTVFNVMYPLGWLPFWEMVENGLFQMQPAKLTNSAVEFLKQHKIVK